MRETIRLSVDRAFYDRIRAAEPRWRAVAEGLVPANEGRAFVVPRGRIVRVIQAEGPQVADLNAWNRDDPKEMFWSGRTRILEGTHLTVDNRLWSTHPRMRPMLTVVNDAVAHRPSPGGSPGHDVLYARCNDRIWEVASGQKGHPNCQDNLARAIAELGLGPDLVHDAFNLFMKTGVSPTDGRLYFEESDGRKGDYVDLYAEIDCLIAISSCPTGTGARGLGTPEVGPLGFRVFEVPA